MSTDKDPSLNPDAEKFVVSKFEFVSQFQSEKYTKEQRDAVERAVSDFKGEQIDRLTRIEWRAINENVQRKLEADPRVITEGDPNTLKTIIGNEIGRILHGKGEVF
jgi:hypothetical protein